MMSNKENDSFDGGMGVKRNSIWVRSWTVIAALLFLNTPAWASIETDLAEGMLVVEAARNAHNDGVNATAALDRFVDAGVDVVKATQTIAKEWSNCEDTYAVVRQSIGMAPEKAPQIVASIAAMNACACSAESFWARSRVEQRLRPEVYRALVRIGNVCSCVAAGVEAAVEVVPAQTEDLIDAVLAIRNSADNPVDVIGTVGRIPDNKDWKSGFAGGSANAVRQPAVCSGDRNEKDDYSASDQWTLADADTTGSAALGQHRVNCGDSDNDRGETNDLIISQYIEQGRNDQALELYNGTDRRIDLKAENYQIEVYFHGYAHPGEQVQLNGQIEPRSTYVVVNAEASPALRQRADQTVQGMVFTGADAISLKNGMHTGRCECSVTAVAAAISGVNDGDDNNQSREEALFFERIKQHYGAQAVQTSVVDSIGQINLGEPDYIDRPVASDSTLMRKSSVCHGDRLEIDAFDARTEWQLGSANNWRETGRHGLSDCAATPPDLILSEYIEGRREDQAIELYNGTARAVNLDGEKYQLAIYNDDDADADQVIDLSGRIEPGSAFVIAHPDANSNLADKASQLTGELDLSSARAVLLKKAVTPSFQSCHADVADWLADKPTIDTIEFVLTPVFDPEPGPDSGDNPRDGDDGGLASPN